MCAGYMVKILCVCVCVCVCSVVFLYSLAAPAISCLVIHTIVILIQATTLSVAMNSYSKALLTIMVSNIFVELKGSVFKKFEINNLFQMSCSGEFDLHMNKNVKTKYVA